MDKTIKILDLNVFREIHSLKENFEVFSILKLKNKDVIITGGFVNSVSFWDTNTFKKGHSVKCCGCFSSNGLIELPNHHIVVTDGNSSTIDIINTQHYQLIKQIKCKGYRVGDGLYSSLHLLNNDSFIYSCKGCFCQISSTTYEILLKSKMESEF